MEFGKESWKTFEQGIQKEWLLTNGIGGFASSTIIGANTRRYHGLLVASLKPPVERHLILSKIDESLQLGETEYKLYSFQTPGYVMCGYHHLQRVVLDSLPCFTYCVEDVFLEKKICMIYGENTVVIVYRVINGISRARLRLTPLVNFRDYHGNSSRAHMRFDRKSAAGEVVINPYGLGPDIRIYCSDGLFAEQEDCWFFNMEYAVERERGLHCTEDHFIPGYFEIDIQPGEDKYITIAASVGGSPAAVDGLAAIEREEERLRRLEDAAGYEDEFVRRLVRAADSFIVHRKSTGSRTVIAGYPWFTDWGRDTMIALPGLTLATHRYDDARDILYTFSRYVKYGLVPNMFPDEGQEPSYNSVDAALWYFEAVSKYLGYTGDSAFVRKQIYDTLKDIIHSYVSGTIFNIRMDEDYLVSAGDQSTQLTWMDAKVGGTAVTPRHGKAVEINALWYNALNVMAALSDEYGEDSSWYRETARKAGEAFINTFWNEEEQCLYDVVTGSSRDGSVRPNQVLAVSLTYPVISGEPAQKVVRKVWKELYTAYGLRTLSPAHPGYIGVYEGGQGRRDTAYHQGTAWTWLLGHFITAFVRVYGNSGTVRQFARRFIEPFKDHLEDACVGYISEIFDGNEPLIPRGCFAQAWSVSEILRAYTEDILKSGETGNNYASKPRAFSPQ